MADLIANPGFETNTSSWDTNSSAFTNSGATFTRITSDFYAGAACMDITYTNATNQMGTNTRTLAFVASTQYRVSAWVRWKSGDTVRLRVRDWNGGGTAVFADSPFCAALDQWQWLTVCFTTGATSNTHLNNVVSLVTSAGAAVAGEFYVDQVSVDTYTAVNSCGILST